MMTDKELKAMKEWVLMNMYKALLTTPFDLCLILILRSMDKVAYRLVKLIK